MNNKRLTESRAHQGMLLWALIVGLSFPAVSLISEGLPPMLLTAIRFLVAAVAIAPMVIRKADFWPGAVGLALYTVMGISLAVFFGTMFWAAHQTTPLTMSTLYVSVPVLAYFFGRVVGVEERAGALLGILAVGAVGALGLALAGVGGHLDQLQFGIGEAAYFVGCMASAAYPVLSKLGLNRQWLSPAAEVRTFWSLVVGSALVGLIGLTIENPAQLWAMTLMDISIVAYLGLFSSGMTFWLTQRAAPVLTPGAVTAYSYLVPFVSMVLLFAQDIEHLGWQWLPGSLLVVLAIALLFARDSGAAGRHVDRLSPHKFTFQESKS